MNIRKASLVLFGMVCVLAPAAACNVPVFRYALEHWPADRYTVTITHRGPLPEPEQELLALLERTANCKVRGAEPVSVPQELPWMTVSLPAGRGGEEVWAGRLSVPALRAVLESPARQEIGRRLQGKADASDVVQEAFLGASRDFPQFRGTTEPEFRAWLRQILANTLANTIRDFGRECRDAALERSLEASLADSSARLEGWLAAQQYSPSEQAQRNEQLLHLTHALAGLPDDQREALLLRHFQGMSVSDIGVQLGRSRAAVASLLRRGLQQLREVLHERG